MKRSPKTVQEESFEVQYTQEGERLDKVLSCSLCRPVND